MKNLSLLTKLFLFAFSRAVCLKAATDSTGHVMPPQVVTAPSEATTPPSPQKTIHEFGQTFVLSNTGRSDKIDTEEYLLEGETAADWTQMLAYQKQTFASPISADRFVSGLKAQFETSPETQRFRLVQQRQDASIFAVQYASNGKNPAQVVLALATVPSAARPNELHLIQFIMNSERVPVAQMEILMKRWQSRFRAQSDALAP